MQLSFFTNQNKIGIKCKHKSILLNGYILIEILFSIEQMSKTHFQLALSFPSTVLSSASGDIVLISDISFWLNYILAISI